MTLLSIAMLVPWVAGVLCLVLDSRRRATGWLAVIAMAVTLVSLVGLTLEVGTNGPVTMTTGEWPGGVGITLRADMLGLLFALLSMGMLQLPPAMISLPFKVLLFVMIDGWNLIVGSIVRSFA